MGSFINLVDKQGGGARGFTKCLWYYISLCSKLVYEGGRGVKNLQNPVYVVYERPLSKKSNFSYFSQIGSVALQESLIIRQIRAVSLQHPTATGLIECIKVCRFIFA